MTGFRKKFRIALLLSLGLLILAPVLLFSLLPKLHVEKLKRDLDNRYVDLNYLGWKQVDLDENMSIRLPMPWSLQQTDTGIDIIDESGETIAIGLKVIIKPASDFKSTVFLGDYFGSNVVSYQSEMLGSGHYGNLASMYLSWIQFEDGSEREQIILHLPYNYEYEYWFCFLSIDYEKEIEAIAWSME